jgi:hypothetical protein
VFNRYEIWFDEKIGDTNSFKKAMDIATEILETIKKYPKEPDEYQLIQIHCYWWVHRLFRVKERGHKKYYLICWSETQQKFV